MKNLEPREVDEYIRFRLRTAGMTNGALAFTPDAQSAIFEYSDGIPRLINTLCDRALIRGCLRHEASIGRDIVEASVMELEGRMPQRGGEAGGTS